jgi:hypothetical protein
MVGRHLVHHRLVRQGAGFAGFGALDDDHETHVRVLWAIRRPLSERRTGIGQIDRPAKNHAEGRISVRPGRLD